MEIPGILAALKGWRTIIVAVICGGVAAMLGAASLMDWAPVLRSYLPDVPAWAVALGASFIAGALRVITTTPPGQK